MAAKPKNISTLHSTVQTNKRVKSSIDEVKLQQQHVGRPSWRFSTADKGGEFRWPDDPQILIEILIKLSSFDSMSWNAIEGRAHHFVSEESLSSSAIKRLSELQKDDLIEALFSFHLSGKKRILGIRYKDHVNLLWYDPDHKACPSTLKHT